MTSPSLKGLSPKDNREVPRLRHSEVYGLKQAFPELTIVLNGGISSCNEIHNHLTRVDGVMLGRTAYHDPYILAEAECSLFGPSARAPNRTEVVVAMRAYAQDQIRRGEPLRAIARHMLGLFHGQPRARLWRRMLSDATRLAANDPGLFLQALEAVAPAPMPAFAD
jgi:tRNA-dihydrouridine synthase A